MQVQLSYRASQGPLTLLVDSTGVKFMGEGEWKRRIHGVEYRRQWRKIHLGVDEKTLQIRAVEVTGNMIGDAPIECVIADGTPACHEAMADHGAMMAIIAPHYVHLFICATKPC
jgi:hypothetical protein